MCTFKAAVLHSRDKFHAKLKNIHMLQATVNEFRMRSMCACCRVIHLLFSMILFLKLKNATTVSVDICTKTLFVNCTASAAVKCK